MKTLAHPYGDCNDNNNISVSECRLACITRAVVEICDCHDVHTTPINNATCQYNQDLCVIYVFFQAEVNNCSHLSIFNNLKLLISSCSNTFPNTFPLKQQVRPLALAVT